MGLNVGWSVGDGVGDTDGSFVGTGVGEIDGAFVGESEGDGVGGLLGTSVGELLSNFKLKKAKQNVSRIRYTIFGCISPWFRVLGGASQKYVNTTSKYPRNVFLETPRVFCRF